MSMLYYVMGEDNQDIDDEYSDFALAREAADEKAVADKGPVLILQAIARIKPNNPPTICEDLTKEAKNG